MTALMSISAEKAAPALASAIDAAVPVRVRLPLIIISVLLLVLLLRIGGGMS